MSRTYKEESEYQQLRADLTEELGSSTDADELMELIWPAVQTEHRRQRRARNCRLAGWTVATLGIVGATHALGKMLSPGEPTLFDLIEEAID